MRPSQSPSTDQPIFKPPSVQRRAGPEVRLVWRGQGTSDRLSADYTSDRSRTSNETVDDTYDYVEVGHTGRNTEHELGDTLSQVYFPQSSAEQEV